MPFFLHKQVLVFAQSRYVARFRHLLMLFTDTLSESGWVDSAYGGSLLWVSVECWAGVRLDLAFQRLHHLLSHLAAQIELLWSPSDKYLLYVLKELHLSLNVYHLLFVPNSRFLLLLECTDLVLQLGVDLGFVLDANHVAGYIHLYAFYFILVGL